MFKKFHKWFEVMLIKVARHILMKRNVQRALFVNRRDNNEMWAMSEGLEGIIKRMDGYNENE